MNKLPDRDAILSLTWIVFDSTRRELLINQVTYTDCWSRLDSRPAWLGYLQQIGRSQMRRLTLNNQTRKYIPAWAWREVNNCWTNFSCANIALSTRLSYIIKPPSIAPVARSGTVRLITDCSSRLGSEKRVEWLKRGMHAWEGRLVRIVPVLKNRYNSCSWLPLE